ncbi:RagB/SusD family nutrient uptake outer membrane protein [Massilibacteroides sp.]|uniref:RagB/SusD family nutrient uptake outer membrane protein n=1 Tax=Massilibacteroides sp. TaxID=2034766 RepID=UPI00261575A7|nr:RagB/SusD family nutrient uptake outer membrane protein [Massilibacteroides sp.]MDD4516606.1 RagB/SusD family nutrient uptake outer membrane protein [Massilibacteroides sp.]
MKKYKILFAAVALSLGLNSCIEETIPTEYVLDEQIGASDAALEGMVNSIYTTMAGYSNSDGGIEVISYGSMRAMLEHSTTQMICSGANGYNTMGAWSYGAVSATGSNRGIYPSYLYYGYIKTVNDIIKMVGTENLDNTKKNFLGICYAYRALYYLDLVQIMEYKKPTDSRYTYVQPENDLTNLGVPIVTEKTTSEEASNNPRATVDEVYDLILSDLAEAEIYLTGFSRTDKTQPNMGAVYGLYARVYANLASRIETSVTYKDEVAYWKKVEEYTDKAISTSGCVPLTESEWTDPINGFNNRNSQNSWMWATSISESNTTASSTGSFVYAMIFGTETTFSAYGWRVGRSLDRKWYERLSDNDFRKKSWLNPNFFYESKNQKAGEAYLIEKDANGKLINNKWSVEGDNSSTLQSAWNDEYSGFGPEKYQYELNNTASWIRSRINASNGFMSWPWLYVNLKFRPHNGEYRDYATGGATDYPIMRVEEMYYLKAEAILHTSGVSAAANALEDIVKTRNNTYECSASSEEDFLDEYTFQKGVEFWGEGINYFDAKRLELGIHRAYLGTNCERYQHCLDMNGIFVGWTPGWNQAELNSNPAIFHYNNPYTNPTTYYVYKSNDDFRPYYGIELK